MVGLDRRGPLLSLLTSIVLMLAFDSPASGQSWADKMFDVKKHDFRTVGRGTKAEYHFDFTNVYEEDVHVSAVRTSCGCTTPSLTQETLTTHETGSVIATFNTNTFIGQKAATITVVFDRPKYAEVQLKVSGFIRTDITFDPPEVNYGELAVRSGDRTGSRDHSQRQQQMGNHRRPQPLQESAGQAESRRADCRNGSLSNAGQDGRQDARR